MSDAVSALGGATFAGFANVREIGPIGMISLRAAVGTTGLGPAVKAACGLDLPGQRQIQTVDDRAVAWMSPDEYLLMMPYGTVSKALAAVEKKLGSSHHLAVDVSDARAVFRIEGPKADQVLMKLCPIDLAALQPGELRRTRAAQVACAIWRDEGGFTLVCFRSVAAYVMGLLVHSAQPGSQID
jgi:sarcosine oxidase subunit gamma